MAPKASVLEAQLAAAVGQLFQTDRESLSVNAARKHVEEKYDLEDGFFRSAKWKAKSKNIITETADELIQAEEAGAAPSPKVEHKEEPIETKNGIKRESTAEGTPAKKRQKLESSATPTKRVKKSESDLSDADEKPSKKRKLGRKKRVVDSDNESENFKAESSADEKKKKKAKAETDTEDEKPTKRQKTEESPERKPTVEADAIVVKKAEDSDESSPLSDVKDEGGDEETKPTVDDDDESELSELIDEPPKRKRKTKPGKQVSKIKEQDEEKEKKHVKVATDDSDSTLSSLIDEPPKRKRKSKGAAGDSAKSKTGSKAGTDLSPDDAEIKKLQGQLVKCGVRKIWAFELKQYGDDSKAKLRHLRGMLKDIGMDGRFSEAKAREIKERRELEADLEAVQAMNENWGVNSGGRASRSRAAAATKKSLKEPSDDEEDDEDDGAAGSSKIPPKQDGDDNDGDHDEDEDDVPKTYSKGRGSAKYKADLAFLGDESESDSDS